MKKGFTLVELLTVLVILALLTHLAVRELHVLQRMRGIDRGRRQLTMVRDAVWQWTPGNAPEGFLVDMGRLPQAWGETNRVGESIVTLRELWERPTEVKPFALRPASLTNLVGAAATRAALVDDSVYIPCGWRGPYLEMPFGETQLRDPWGNDMISPDEAGFARLAVSNAVAPRAGEAVRFVSHWGADARPDDQVAPADEADRDATVSLAPPGGITGDLFLTVSVVSDFGVFVAPATNLTARWYAPSGGSITGGVETVVGGQAWLRGLPIGVCYLKAGGPLRPVVIRPGDNALTLLLPKE